MPRTGSFRHPQHLRLLLAVVLFAAAFTYACNNSNSPTAPAPPPTNAANGVAGTNLAVTEGSHIDLEKATNGEDADEPLGPQIAVGDAVTWTYTVTNTGSLPLIGIVVRDDDDKVGIVECPFNTLASGKSMTCTATGVAEEGQYRNVAIATGTTSQGQEATDEDPSHYFGIVPGQPQVEIEKATNGEDADEATGPEIVVDGPVEWTYVITNTGDVPLQDVSVSDNRIGAVVCPATTLDAGQSMTCTADGFAVEGQYRNVGTVVAKTADGAGVGAEDASHYVGVPFEATPEVDIEKSTNGVDADVPTGPVVNVGDPITWTYRVTNIGNVDLVRIVVTDDQIGAIACPATQLAVGKSMTCEAGGFAIEGQYANVATVTAIGPEEVEAGDEDASHYIGIVETPGLLSCSHGYWKNHLVEWSETPYTPADLVGDVFASAHVYPFIADSTLLEALEFPGGPGVDGAMRILLRQAVAALLNAAHPGVTAPHTVAEIVDMVNTAIDTGDRQTILALSGDLDADNNLGCPLN